MISQPDVGQIKVAAAKTRKTIKSKDSSSEGKQQLSRQNETTKDRAQFKEVAPGTSENSAKKVRNSVVSSKSNMSRTKTTQPSGSVIAVTPVVVPEQRIIAHMPLQTNLQTLGGLLKPLNMFRSLQL